MDYMTILMKQGYSAELALVSNNLWRACGLRHITIMGRQFQLREVEEV